MADAFELKLGVLKGAADNWLMAKLHMYSAANRVSNSTSLNPNEMGLFSEFYKNYAVVSPFARDRLYEGGKVCNTVAEVLLTGHETYQAAEEQNRESFTGLN